MKNTKFFGVIVSVIVLSILSYIVISLTSKSQSTIDTSTQNPPLDTSIQPSIIDTEIKQLSADEAVWVKVSDPRLPVKAIWYPSFGLDSSYIIDSYEELVYGTSTTFAFLTQYGGSNEFDQHVGEAQVYFSDNKNNLSVEDLLISTYESDYEINLWKQADAYEYVEYDNGVKGYMAKLGPLPKELQDYLDEQGFAPWVSGFTGISPDGSKIISMIADNSGEGNLKKVTPDFEDDNYFLHATLERMEF